MIRDDPDRNCFQPLRVAVIGSGPAAFYAVEHLFKQTRAGRRSRHVRPPAHALRARALRRRARSRRRSRPSRAPTTTIAAQPALSVLRQRRVRPSRDARRSAAALSPVCSRPARRPTGTWASPAKTSPAAIRQRSSSPGTTGTPTTVTTSSTSRSERAAVVGVGNVAIDVARILVRTPEELAKTDIAAHALEALRNSRIKEVFLLGPARPGAGGLHQPGGQGDRRDGRRGRDRRGPTRSSSIR